MNKIINYLQFMFNDKEKRRMTFFSLTSFLITFFVFYPSIYSDFIFWDDYHDLVFNPYLLNSSSLQGFIDYLTSVDARWFLRFIPFSRFTFFINYLFDGTDPYYYHLTNVLLHAFNSYIFFKVICAFRFSPFNKSEVEKNTELLIYLLITLFWSINPLRVEAVSWVTARPHLLSYFWTGLLILRISKLENSPQSSYKMIIVFYILSLLSNPTTVTMPIILFFFRKKLKLSKSFWFLLFLSTTVILSFSLSLEYQRGMRSEIELAKRMTNFAYIAFNLILRSLLMKPQIPWDTRLLGELTPNSFDYFLGVLALLLTTLTFYFYKTQNNISYLSWLCFLILFFPVSGFSSAFPMTLDRYAYLASAPLFMVYPFWSSQKNKFPLILQLSFLFILVFNSTMITIIQQNIWSTDRQFFAELVDSFKEYPEIRNDFSKRYQTSLYYKSRGPKTYQETVEKYKLKE
jgi:hypothetical protein